MALKSSEERSAYNKRYRLANLKRIQDSIRKWRYGITPTEYEARLIEQNFCCAICMNKLDLKKRTHIDHKGKIIRGILCHDCNVGLGHFKDNPDLLWKAIAYVLRWTQNSC